MQRLKRLALILALLACCVGCDQTTKLLARDHLQGHAAQSFLGDTLRLQYAENPGAFLSLGASLPHEWAIAAFTMGGTIAIAGVFLYAVFASRPGWRQTVALTLICAGGIGNLIDRFRYDGHVTDFLNMGIGSVRTGIFNIADVALMAGVTLFVLRIARAERLDDPATGSR